MAGDSSERVPREDSNGQRTNHRDDPVLVERPLERPLPAGLREQLETLLADSSVETLGGWVEEVRARTGGGPIDVEDLCHADDETSHYGVTPDETRHFQCFFDAVLLTGLLDDPVDVHTVSPGGTEIELAAVETDAMTVRPESAVFSFGISDSLVVSPAREPTHQDVYAAICPYVRAFPTASAYREWAAEAAAQTVALPLTDARGLAARFVE
jgi:alkylmercury lyase